MATIYINRNDSKCGACWKGADPGENGHYTILGYTRDRGQPGCGEPWTSVYSNYYDIIDILETGERLRFPNLKDLPVRME